MEFYMSIESFASVPAMLLHRVKATPDTDAFYYPDDNDNWRTLTWKDVEAAAKDEKEAVAAAEEHKAQTNLEPKMVASEPKPIQKAIKCETNIQKQ